MKNASEYVQQFASNLTGWTLNERDTIYLHNLFLQVQADAFEHAAALVDEDLRDVDVKGPGIFLRQHARLIWPGAPTQSECPPGEPPAGYPAPTVSISSPSNEVEKRDTLPAATPALTAKDFGGTMPQPEPPQDKYVPESPESST